MIYPALSLIEPWLAMILAGSKTVEFRTWTRASIIGKDLLLCSSKRRPKNDHVSWAVMEGHITTLQSIKMDDMLGHARCIVTVEDIVPATIEHRHQPGFSYHKDSRATHAWKLKDVRPIEPFPVKGSLGIYKVEREEITYL